MKLLRNFSFALVLTLSTLASSCARLAYAQSSFPDALKQPKLIADVYMVSPYANTTVSSGIGSGIIPINPLYFASPETAEALAVRFGAVLVKAPGAEFRNTRMWHFVEIKAEFFKVLPLDIFTLLSLPETDPIALGFPSGCAFNAGEIASFYIRNPQDKAPGLADKYALAYLRSECPADDIHIH